MEQTKKMLCSVLLFFILFSLLLPTVAFADMGPKPRVHIIVENPPEEYYLDLLTQLDYRTITTKEPTKLAQWQQQQEALEFNDTILQQFYSLESEGWYPMYVQMKQTGKYIWLQPELLGTLQEDGTALHSFPRFHGKEGFRMILVTADGETRVSDVMESSTVWTTVTYNYATDEITKKSNRIVYLMQFSITCTGTLILEGILLILFRLLSRRNLKLFFAVNILTQIGLSILVGVSMIQKGPLGAMIVMFPAEAVILAAETMIYHSCMDTGSIDRITVYSIIANLFSWIIGTYFLYDLFYFLAKFM